MTMDIIYKIQGLLSGYKTYIVGGLMIALGLYLNDKALILNGLGLITLRAGLAKV